MLGVLLSYLLVIAGVFVFDWSPISIFIAYYLELVVLIIFYVIVRSIDEKKNPVKYRKLPGAFNILYGSIPLLALQLLFISFIAAFVSKEGIIPPMDLMNKNGGWITLGVLIITYLIRTLNSRSIETKEYELQQNIFMEVLALSGTSFLGMFAAVYIDYIGVISLLISMTVGRAAIELYFRYKTNWI